MQAEQQSELLDDKSFPFYELRFIMRVLSHEGDAPREDWKTARGMAREIFVRWHGEKIAALSHPSTAQGWQQDVPEGCTPHDAKVLREANHAFAEENQQLRKALRFYASREHFNLADSDAWDTVSGEPQNWWCDEAGTATIEDGTIAAMALRGEPIDWGGEDGLQEPPVCPGEPESLVVAPPEQGSKG